MAQRATELSAWKTRVYTEMENRHTEFSAIEMGIGLFFLAIPVDLLCLVIDMTGVGLAVAPFLQIIAVFSIRWWLKMKGDPNALRFDGKQVTRLLSNILPFVPTVTIIFLLDVYVHNHPEKFKALQAVGSLGSTDISVQKLKNIRETKGTVAAVREVRKQYKTVMDGESEQGRRPRPSRTEKGIEYKQAA